MTVTYGSTPALVPEAPGGSGHAARRMPAMPTSAGADRDSTNRHNAPGGDAGLLRATADARAALREAASAAVEAAARAHSLAAQLDETLTALADGQPTPPLVTLARHTPQPRTDTLSSREREVLALIAEGRTNKAIAEVLFVSPNTVKTHVTSLLHKLHADSRAQLAAIATRDGLHQRDLPGPLSR